jgi:hypothetical protein
METQVKLVSAVAVLHNYILKWDPDDIIRLDDIEESEDTESCAGDEADTQLQAATISRRETQAANARRTEIARNMWNSYLASRPALRAEHSGRG